MFYGITFSLKDMPGSINVNVFCTACGDGLGILVSIYVYRHFGRLASMRIAFGITFIGFFLRAFMESVVQVESAGILSVFVLIARTGGRFAFLGVYNATVEQYPQSEGRQMTMLLVPKKR